MRNGRGLMFLAAGLLVLIFGARMDANAQGVIVPRRCQPCPRPIPLPPALPVKSIKIETKIAGQVATTHVEQVFRNDTDATLEGVYFFPIPETASITEFAIWENGKRLVGEVRSREEARRIYDAIVRQQRDPGLLEYAGRDLFQASVFPIPPHSDKKLEIRYAQILKSESGTVSYRYPLGTGRNVSRIVGTVSGRVTLEGREPLRNIYSPTHEIETKTDGDARSRVSFESKAGEEARDFQLFYTTTREEFGLSLITHREPGKAGYFLLMLSPKGDLSEGEYAAKDIVFVLDTSGSMSGAGKMDKARAALLFGVRSLRDADRFNIINFAGEEHLMSPALVQADAAGRARGEEFIQALRPVGGTNINSALIEAMKQFFVKSERPRMIVFITDGLPTVGETNPQRITENARLARTEGVRLFTFGVGYDVNAPLLDKLAAENGGVADYVEPGEDIEVKVSNFFAKVSHPVLTNIELEMGGVETDLTYPRETPDLFRGSQITLIGRYKNESDLRGVALRLTGRAAGRESRSFTYENLRFPLEEAKNEFLPRLWATRRVGWLMEQVRTNGESQELRDEIVDLGTRYGIVTPYTSYLALEDGATQITGGRNISSLPSMGRSAGGAARVIAPPPPPSPADASAATGAAAVRESKRARTQQEAMRVDAGDADFGGNRSSTRRNVGDKTFYLREGVWTDAEYKEDAKLPQTVLAFGSEEYFSLIQSEPKLARYFALGERVVVVFNGRVYRVNADKP